MPKNKACNTGVKIKPTTVAINKPKIMTLAMGDHNAPPMTANGSSHNRLFKFAIRALGCLRYR